MVKEPCDSSGMEGRKNNTMDTDALKNPRSESLSLSSSSSSEGGEKGSPPASAPAKSLLPPRSEAGEKGVPPKPPPPKSVLLPPRSEAGEKAVSPMPSPPKSLLPPRSEVGEKGVPPKPPPPKSLLLPPRSPPRPKTTMAAQAISYEEEIVFYPNDQTKIGQNKSNVSSNGGIQQPYNLLETIEERKKPQQIERPPPVIRKSSNAANSVNSTLGRSEGASGSDSKVLENEHQSQTPQRTPVPGHHERRVSWGGKMIQIPQLFNDNSVPPLFPERPNDLGDADSRKATRTLVASELVSNIEAAMKDEGIDVSSIINTKYQDDRQDESATPAIDMDDLAKVHPIESPAALGVVEDIEFKEHKEDRLQDEEQVEGVANFFNTSDAGLLDNVPKGAEDLFQRGGTIPPAPSITGESTNSQPPESIAGGSEQSPKGGRARINSVSQFSMASVRSNSRRSIAGHNRTNTMTSSRTMISGAKSPHPPPIQNRRQHRRQETMEERLFSLNQALDAIDAPGPSLYGIFKRQDQDANNIEQQENAAKYHHAPDTSLDLFNQNLTRLFQGDDGDPGNGLADYDEKEVTPLVKNRFEASAHPLDANNISTSSTGSTFEQKQNERVTEDASIDNSAKPAAQTNANDLNQSVADRKRMSFAGNSSTLIFQEPEVLPKPDEDIEEGRFNSKDSNLSTNDFASSSSHDGKTYDRKTKRSNFRRFLKKVGSVADMEYFVKSRTPFMLKFLKNLFWLILAATFFSAIMYYGLGNPTFYYGDLVYDKNDEDEKGEDKDDFGDDDDIVSNLADGWECKYRPEKITSKSNAMVEASYSWWTLYILVRLPITFTMARFFEILLIHFMILDWRWLGSCIGSTVTLLIVQAKVSSSSKFILGECSCFRYHFLNRFFL